MLIEPARTVCGEWFFNRRAGRTNGISLDRFVEVPARMGSGDSIRVQATRLYFIAGWAGPTSLAMSYAGGDDEGYNAALLRGPAQPRGMCPDQDRTNSFLR
jgi:hypothetical protein